MFKPNKKNAMSFVELLILLVIVGILFLMYQKAYDKEAMLVKVAYKNILENMRNYAATVAENNGGSLPALLCDNLFSTINTSGEKNCGLSMIPNLPNFVSVNGMRFFGAETPFQQANDSPLRYLILRVDIDGVGGKNEIDSDILSLEIIEDGTVRPSGAFVQVGANNVYNNYKGNVARDPKVYAVQAFYVPQNANDRDDFVNMGNRLSYAEAQCLTGNPFPYRANSGVIQMCIEDDEVRGDITEDGIFNAADELAYWNRIMSGDVDICNNLYNSVNSVANGLVNATDNVINNCQRCYQLAYKEKFCSNGETTNECIAVQNVTGACRVLDI